MSNQFFAYSDNPAQYRAALIRSIEQAGRVGEDQLDELRALNATLDSVLSEMEAVRRTQARGVAAQEQALAVQQAMLGREVFQDRLEEFVYQFERMVGQFEGADPECPPSTQYFLLDALFKQVQAAALTTAVIRGRENKAAFDACLKRGKSLFRRLASDPDVANAVAWAEAERQRRQIADGERLAKQQAEEQQRRAKQEAEEQRRRAEERRRLEERKKARVRLQIIMSGFATQGATYKAFHATVLIDGQPVGTGNLVAGFNARVELSQGSHSVQVVVEKPKPTGVLGTLFPNPLADLRKHHVLVLDENTNRILAVNCRLAGVLKRGFGNDWLEVEFVLS